MEIQTEQKKSKKAELRSNEKVLLKTDKINLVLCAIGGGIVGSALFAATTFGGQTVTNISTLIGGLGGGLGGGVISGFLTLQGVRKTIELQKEKELVDSEPDKIRSLHLMINLVNTYNGKLLMLRRGIHTIPDDGNTGKLEELVDQWEKEKGDVDHFRDRMFEESLKVNPDVYFYLKERVPEIEKIDSIAMSYIMTGTHFPIEGIKEEIKEFSEESGQIIVQIIDRLNKELDAYEQSLFSRKS
ncbi:hypothetical protein [Bacillus arachidis]|uniref:Uncharacterized protein n=1 Tax=Bacillus arachidis TaxID=2819290 RepID=A0ABS3P4V4_9BACI|nr:hypothetical protein [Bacillus arachidis]MBO1627810.1 hypothetical protein [Bacillus arachidis]